MAVIALSSEMMATGKRLGKAVGQEVLSFQRRDARHWKYRIGCTSRSEGAWRIGKRDRDQASGNGRSDRKADNDRGPTVPKPGRAARR